MPANLANESWNVYPAATLTSDPAANSEVSQAVQTGRMWELWAVTVTLVTDANVGNRQVTLIIDDGANIIAQVTAQPTQAASLTYTYTWAVGAADRATVVGTSVLSPLPGPLTLPAGYRIRTSTLGRAATDNFGPANIHAIRYQS